MKHSELLREAYKYIEAGREKYICYAVEAVYRDTDEVSSKVRDDVETYISDLPYQYKLKLSRLAWIEWMIAQYEAKGM